ncbi:hypothetical protein L6R53_27290 [Myxococcota bacterium]|nr:hypothetical protein [Myxococcota bacterium]
MRSERLVGVLALHMALALACGDDEGDTGADTGTAGDGGGAGDGGAGDGGVGDGGAGDGGASDGGAGDGGGGDGGTGDGGTGDGGTGDGGGTEPTPLLVDLPDPCDGAGTPYAMLFTDEEQGWVGCGSGMGLWRSEDGGESFTAGHPSADLYVFDLVAEPDGALLVCGHDYDVGDGALLYRLRGGAWQELLRYGNNATDPAAVYMSNCGAVGSLGDGRLVVASNTAGDITVSEDDGLRWIKEERYWEEANLAGGYSYYYVMDILTAGGAWYGAGSQISEPPVFYGQSTAPDAAWWNRAAHVIDAEIDGEVWALSSPDDGATWLAGGRDQGATSRASGFLYRSTDGGQTWSGGELGGSLDIVHDLAFAEDGLHGVAVGHRYPPSSLGGFVIVTFDGGRSWTEVDEEVPILQSAAARGDRFWVAGDAFLASGSFEAVAAGAAR